jgi:hypothetical protein
MTKAYYENIAGEGPSTSIWWDCPILDMLRDPNVGYFQQDNFLEFGQVAAADLTTKYAVYADTGVILAPYKELGGGLEVSGNDLDNDEGSITGQGNTGAPYRISDGTDEARKLWFECRLKKASIADNALALFCGLSEEGTAVAEALVDNTGVCADKDRIGFSSVHAAGETLNAVYKKAGQTQQTIIAGIHTFVADTYVKLGFVYDPAAEDTKKVTFFVNGVAQTTYITAALIAAATFPDAELLALHFATKVGASAESKAQLKWWRVAQLW